MYKRQHLTFDRQAEHEDIEAARRHLDYVRRASDIVPRLPQQPRSGLSPSEIVDQLSRLIQQRRENHDDLARLRQELKRIQPDVYKRQIRFRATTETL